MSELKEELQNYLKELETMPSTSLVKGDVAFEISWHYYPLKIGKKAAKRHYLKSVKTKGDYDRTIVAHNRYSDYISQQRRKGFKIGLQHGATFFNNWEDWAIMAEEEE